MSAELSPRSRPSLPPISHRVADTPARLRSELCSTEPPIVLLTVAGRLTLSAIESSREFGDVVRALGGRPYRVLCDFTQTVTMPEDVCAVFVRGQEFALASGMERDAFACTSSVLRLQFARIARESGRSERLGPLHFFDTVAQARAYLEASAPEPGAAVSSRRAPNVEQGEAASSRRIALDLGDGAPSRRAPAISLRAAAPSRPHSRG